MFKNVKVDLKKCRLLFFKKVMKSRGIIQSEKRWSNPILKVNPLIRYINII